MSNMFHVIGSAIVGRQRRVRRETLPHFRAVAKWLSFASDRKAALESSSGSFDDLGNLAVAKGGHELAARAQLVSIGELGAPQTKNDLQQMGASETAAQIDGLVATTTAAVGSKLSQHLRSSS